MIVGRGSLAKLLNDREGFIFFAAGISNSQIKNDASIIVPEYRREAKLLGENIEKANESNSMFVYFSSISIFTTDTPYTENKLAAEYIIKLDCNNYTILRLGNIWECTNPHTFINAYKTKPYQPREEYRYMISKEQLNFITDNLPPTGKHEISIFGELLTVAECLKRTK